MVYSEYDGFMRVRTGGVISLGLILFACKTDTADESYRDVAVNNQQLFSRHIELAAQFVGLPVDYSEALMVWVKDWLQEL